MLRLQFLLFLSVLTFASAKLGAQTFVGPGPDPACGGTELKIVQKGSNVSLIQQTVFASNCTIVEQYRPLPNKEWEVTLLLYSSRWQKDESLTKARLIRTATFKASDKAKADEIKQVFGYGDIIWSEEPKRLVDYFHANRSDFHK